MIYIFIPSTCIEIVDIEQPHFPVQRISRDEKKTDIETIIYVVIVHRSSFLKNLTRYEHYPVSLYAVDLLRIIYALRTLSRDP